MRAEFAKRKLAWGKITGQELTDMLVYLQNLPETRNLAHELLVPAVGFRREAVRLQGLHGVPRGQTRARSAAQESDPDRDRGGHVESPAQHEESAADVRRRKRCGRFISYIWAKQYFRGTGSADRGKKVFAAKNCATCHNDPPSGAPKLGKGKDAYSDITMVAALWDHGPQMLELMTPEEARLAALHRAGNERSDRLPEFAVEPTTLPSTKIPAESALVPIEFVDRRILLIRGQKVMLDRDLAELYGVETRVLNQAVRRNVGPLPGQTSCFSSRAPRSRIGYHNL